MTANWSKRSHRSASASRGRTTKRALHPRRLDQLSVNTIRFLAVDEVQRAESGHPGLPMGDGGAVIRVGDFGASALGPVVVRNYGFTHENICQRALELVKPGKRKR
jgi:transketolase